MQAGIDPADNYGNARTPINRFFTIDSASNPQTEVYSQQIWNEKVHPRLKQRKIITNTAQGCKDGNYSEIDQPQNTHSCENYAFQ